MLDPFSRGAIVALCALCVAGAFALMPLGARSSNDSPRVAPIVRSSAVLPYFVALEPIKRDPFAQPTLAPATPPPASTPSYAAPGGPLEPLPSNVGNDTIPAIPGAAQDPLAASAITTASSGIRVSAVVTGTRPYAMVETAGVHEIKGLGDRIAGSPIVSIDLTGIRLQNGARLSVDAQGPLL